MRNLRLEIEYDGTDYCGWQVQKNPKKRSIQEVIEKTLQRTLHEKVRLIASGRTDSGAHAFEQIANFKTNSRIPALNIRKALNSALPMDISIKKISRVSLDFHSRFDAKSKIYQYWILNSKARRAFSRDFVYFYPYPLDIKLMRQAGRLLLGRKDFKSFCASGSNAKKTVRTIKQLRIKKFPYRLPLITSYYFETIPLIIFQIEADGFLYNMVRNIVGTLLEVGRGRLTEKDIKWILLSKDRNLAGPTVPAKGLFLAKVRY